jgi:uncharacterized protein (TIGR03382 family)
MRRTPLLALLLVLAGCAPDVEDTTDHRTFAYKHGPPSSSPPYAYFLTSYGGPDDKTIDGIPACGGRTIDGSWYYATGAYTYGCGARLRLEAGGRCVVVKVVDNGPAGWVEQKASYRCGGTGYIIDASPLVSKHLYGVYSAGWSDCLKIQVTPVDGSTPLGPSSCSAGGASSSSKGGFIGEACGEQSACSSTTPVCLEEDDGYPGGMCTKPCQRICPDRKGHPTTFCIADKGSGYCFSRCDYLRHGATGCRHGYRCVKMPRHSQSYIKRNTCVPDAWKTDTIGGGPPDAEGDLPNPEAMAPEAGGGCSTAPRGGGGTWLLALLLAGLALLRLESRRRGP